MVSANRRDTQVRFSAILALTQGMFRTSNLGSKASLSLGTTGVCAGMEIPANAVAGPFPGEFQIGLHVTDVQTTKHFMEVTQFFN